MKILFHHRVAAKSGQFVHIEELVAALREAGHSVAVIGPRRFTRAEFGADAGVIRTLRRYAPKTLYEVMEIAYSALAFGRLCWAYWRFRPDVVYERFNLFLMAALWLKRVAKVPLLLEVNSPLAQSRLRHDGLVLKGLADWTQQIVWKGADLVLPVSHALAGHVRRAGVPPERIYVIPNGVDPRRFLVHRDPQKLKRDLGLAKRQVLGFTGFVRPWHKLEVVIDLLSDLIATGHDWHLLVVGDGEVVPALWTRAATRGVTDRLTVTGVVPRNDIANFIAVFDIALQPGVTEYASPLKLFEYMIMSKAIVAPDTPNIREVLTPELDAVLFNQAEPNGFRKAILRLASDQDLRTRLGAAAYRTITTRQFTWENNAATVVRLARQLCSASA